MRTSPVRRKMVRHVSGPISDMVAKLGKGNAVRHSGGLLRRGRPVKFHQPSGPIDRSAASPWRNFLRKMAPRFEEWA